MASSDLLLIRLRIALAQLQRLFERHAVGHISVQRIVRRSLIGENVGHHAAFGKLGNDVRAIADQPDRNVFFFADGIFQNAQRLVERGDEKIAVAGLEALLDALGIDVNPKKRRAGHGSRQRLRASHSAHAAGDDQLAAQISAKMFVARRIEGLVGALNDPLRADVDPRSCRHLPIHHQPGALQFVELLPVGKMADEIRVGDEHARRVVVRLEHSHRLARLHQQRLVVRETLQRVDDGVIAIPIAGSFARTAVDDQILRALGNFLVKIVHQHAHGCFLLPTFAGERGAARGANAGVRRCWSFDINGHGNMVVLQERNHQSEEQRPAPLDFVTSAKLSS